MICRLTDKQLEAVMHLANGKSQQEIADELHYSLSNVNKTLLAARRKQGAKTNAHLVSITISQGVLYWTEDRRTTEAPDSPRPETSSPMTPQ